MKRYLVAKILTLVSFLPLFAISAHSREEHREIQQGGQRNMQQHQVQHPGETLNHSQLENQAHRNEGLNNAYRGYGGYGNYGAGSSGAVVTPSTPLPNSQPGMIDDSNNLYHSYQQQQPGH